MNRQIKVIDYILIIAAIISLLGLLIYFLAAFSPNGEYGTKNYDPFHDYYTNSGIIALMITRFFTFALICIIGFKWIKNKAITGGLLRVILIATISLAFLDWIELWYGSTFYYGEIRDKQGLGFPIFSLLLLLYSLRKIQLPRNMYRTGLMIGMTLLYLWFYNLVKEPWILDGLYIPGTTIKIF